MSLFVAALGVKALYLTYAWLISCVIASWLSERKGYGEKPGLTTGLLLSAAAIVIWLLWPAKPDSRWKVQGAFSRKGSGKTLAEARAERDAAAGGPPPS
jgi:hypothetical protein